MFKPCKGCYSFMGYRDYPSRMPTDATEKEKFLRKLGLEHLLRVWQWFEVYHLEPYVPPYFSLPKEAYQGKKGGDDDEGGSGVSVIDIKGSFLIFDFGDYLATSAGEEYGALSTAKLFRTLDKMFDILKERGATEVAFGRGCLTAAKLYSWHKAMNAGINVLDYKPTEEDFLRVTHVFGDIGLTLEEAARPE